MYKRPQFYNEIFLTFSSTLNCHRNFLIKTFRKIFVVHCQVRSVYDDTMHYFFICVVINSCSVLLSI